MPVIILSLIGVFIMGISVGNMYEAVHGWLAIGAGFTLLGLRF
jgi:hypothetical protein